MLVVALLLAGAAAFAIFQYLSGVEEDILAGQTQVPVFRALQAVPEGTEGNFVLQGLGTLYQASFEEQEDIPADAITSEDQLRSVLGGKVAAGPISANQIMTTNQWVQLTVAITPLSELIGEGNQALTISPGQIQGVNGFVQPGDKVNMIVTLDIDFELTALTEVPDFGIPVEEDPNAEDTTETRTVRYTRFVLQGLPVLAVGRDVRPDEEGPTEVEVAQSAEGEVQEEGTGADPSTVFTLELTPEQAERVVFAQDTGTIYLTLVPKEDFVEVATKGVTIDNLFTGDLVTDIFGN